MLFAVIPAAHELFWRLPNRNDIGPALTSVRFEPVRFGSSNFGHLELRGAWRVTAGDPRFQGISALSLDGGRFWALTDSGVLVRFPKPGAGTQALIDDLPAGPGNPRFKGNRDSEALLRDPAGNGWWVAFENRHELWRYDAGLRRPEVRIRLRPKDWRRNSGIEALVPVGDGLLLFPEPGRTVLHIQGTRMRAHPLNGIDGRISDAATLPDGRVLLVERSLGLTGFSSALLIIDRSPGGYRIARRIRLSLGRLDNVEAIAAEKLADGRARLWLMTDDNGQQPLRTLLIALDLPQRR